MPCVAVPATQWIGISRCSAPSNSRSDPSPSPPVMRTAPAPRSTMRSASVLRSPSMPARTRASARLGVTTVASGTSDVISTSSASGSSSAAPVLARSTGSTTSGVGWSREEAGHRDDDLRGKQRSGLRRVDADIVVHSFQLRGDDPRGQREGRHHRRGVLRGDADERRHPVAPRRGECLEVGLYPGSATGVGGCDGQAARWCHASILDAPPVATRWCAT